MASTKTILIVSLLILICSPMVLPGTIPQDSVGIRTIDQKAYIIHKVERGETLYAISKRYNVEVQTLFDANPGSMNGIDVGQDLRIPTTADAPSPRQEDQNRQNVQEGDLIVHTVAAGESLSVISRKYGVSVNDIKRWNGMRGNNLSVGQRLKVYPSGEMAAEIKKRQEVMETNGKKIHIVSSGETVYSITNKYNITQADLKEWNRLENNTLSIGQELIVGYLNKDAKEQVVIVQDIVVTEEPADEVKVTKINVAEPEMQKASNTGTNKKVTEKGMARVIEGSDITNKYLALHKDAAIGTIMQIKNEMNDLSVFVRVIGKIPGTDDNRNILIKVSQVAYDRLGAIDEQFPVEITYHP